MKRIRVRTVFEAELCDVDFDTGKRAPIARIIYTRKGLKVLSHKAGAGERVACYVNEVNSDFDVLKALLHGGTVIVNNQIARIALPRVAHIEEF